MRHWSCASVARVFAMAADGCLDVRTDVVACSTDVAFNLAVKAARIFFTHSLGDVPAESKVEESEASASGVVISEASLDLLEFFAAELLC